MRLALPKFVRHSRLLLATIVAIAIGAGTMLAQLGTFTAPFEGQLWRVHQQLSPVGGTPGGSVFTASMLYIADQYNASIVAYSKTTWTVSDLPSADWNKTGIVGNPAFGLLPNEMSVATVLVNGVSTQAILVSDLNAPRMLAFRADGTHLFTLQLNHPAATGNDTSPLINGIAMGPGASFTFTSGAAPQLSLTGAFAAAWTNAGRIHGAALAYRNVSFGYAANTGAFSATPSAVLDGSEGVGVGPTSYETYGVVFDAAGNLYTSDTATERINVYDSNNSFAHRFRFGTPAPDNGVTEFSQPFGLAFWPDANGGLLFIGDVLNNRVAVYRPNIAGGTLTYISSLDQLPPAVDPQPFSVSIDPSTGLIAFSDFAVPSVWVLKTADLVAYNLQLLDPTGVAIDTVCTGANYRLRFTLTVPAGHPIANGVVPVLTVGTQLVDNASIVGQPSGNPRKLQPQNTATYTYALSMSGVDDVPVVAGASATSTPLDILAREGIIPVADCSASNAPPQMAMSPSIPAQVSGWFPVYGQSLSLTLTATDDKGVKLIEYKLGGTNDLGVSQPPVAFSGTNKTESLTVPMPEIGFSTIQYRARDSQNIWSAWQTREIRIAPVTNRQTNEGVQDTFTIGSSVGTGYLFSATGLPPGVSIDPATGQLSGQLLFNAAGVYPVTMTESLGSQSSSYAFTWTVFDVNRPPTITPVNPATIPPIIEGEPFQLQVQGSDPDGDRTVFTVTGASVPLGLALPGGSISINRYTGLITGTFPLDSQPVYVLTVGLAECGGSDVYPVECAGIQPRLGLATVTTITVNVINKNQPPTIISPGPKLNAEGDTIVPLQIVASDPDVADRGDRIDFEVENLPPGLTMDLKTGLITGTVSYTAGGDVTYPVVVRARDLEGVRPLPFITFNWTITNVNSPPVPVNPGNLVNDEGDLIRRQFAATDIDATDTLTFTATGLPPGLTMSPTGLVTGQLSYTTAASYPVTMTVNDGTTTRSVSFTWTINNVNLPPDLINPGSQSSAEGATISLPISASDPDVQVLIYKASGLPPGLSINSATGVISGVLSAVSAGTHTVTVTATDPALASDSEIFIWTIGNVNLAPRAVDDVASATQGVPTVLNVLSNDTDEEIGTMLKVVGVTTPSVGTVTITNGGANVTYTAPATYLGAPATFSYTVTDGIGGSASAVVTVNVLPSNRAPVCVAAKASPGLLWPPNHKPRDITITGVTDPDGGVPVISFTSISQDEPTDAVGEGNTLQDAYIDGSGTSAWVRAERMGGENGRVYLVGFIASDGAGGSCSGTVLLGVPHDQGQRDTPIPSPGRWNSITGALLVAPPPVANDDAIKVSPGAQLNVSIQSNDVVYGAVAVSITSQPAQGIVAVNGDGTVTYTAPLGWKGATSFTYRLTNAAGADTAVVFVTVK